jgi:hypothetical protein
VLLEGTSDTSFPHLLQGRVYADSRRPEAYFSQALDLLLSLCDLPPHDPLATELEQLVRGPR